MRIAVPVETAGLEPRVAVSPETVRKFLGLGANVVVQAGAGIASGIPDRDFEAAGATVKTTDILQDADVVLRVRRPAPGELQGLKRGALVVAIMDPYGQDEALREIAEAGATSFAMELMPRITRAQVMDVLSSQANLAGYRSVIDAAEQYGRAFPMMMTAAGTVPAAKVFIMGVGVAGLQAIATARRLGAIVTATDVRPATKEQVESLGAKFVAVEDEEFKQAETSGGYAKEMSDGYKAKQAALVAEPHRQAGHRDHHGADSRPARPQTGLGRHGGLHAPGLGGHGSCGRTRRQLRACRSPGEVVDANGVKIVGYTQRGGQARRDGLEPLRPQPVRLRGNADRQGHQVGQGQSGRRTRARHLPHARRPGDPPELPTQGGLTTPAGHRRQTTTIM